MKNKLLLSLLALTDYKLLEPIPLGESGEIVDSVSTANYIGGLFRLALAVAGALAVFRLIYAGITYMSSDAFNKKNEAKGIIENALWGLGLAMGAWLIVALILPPTEKGAFIFDLSFSKTTLPEFDNAPTETGEDGGGGGGGENGTGCQGNCPYSYKNADGTIVKYRDCVSCSRASSYSLNFKQTTVDGKPVQINSILGNKLETLSKISGNPTFRITEAWPPTVNHRNQGQYDGTSVDVSLNAPAPGTVAKFIQNAKSNGVGLSVMYEVSTKAKRQSYINGGVPAENIIVVPYITNEHFSIPPK